MTNHDSETPLQRGLRRFGPLGILAAMVLFVGLLVARTPAPTTATAGAAPGSPGGVAPVDLSDPNAPVSWSEARANNLSVTFGPGCDQTRGRVAVPSAFAPECYAQRPSNGGATAPGVTGDAIKVVLYQPAPDPLIDQILAAIGANDTADQVWETYKGYFEIYQRYYETYGRKVELIRFAGTGTAADEVAARADATNIADDIAPFAVFGGQLLTSAFGDELAARKIIQIDLASTKSTKFFNEHAPYNWNILAAPNQTSAVVAEYLAKRLKGKPAIHAGDPALRTQTRKFGLLYLAIPGNNDAELLRELFHEQLEREGVEMALEVGSVDPTSSATQQIAKLKEAGITTVLFSGDPLSPGNFTREATSQNYFPEWIITGSALTDSTTFARNYDPQQWSHAFGVSQLFARGRPEANWSYYLYRWYHGADPPAINGTQIIFPLPTVLFTGIMFAGPVLTPETFRAGLWRGEPIGGGLTVPQVSFGNHGFFAEPDFNGIDDTVEIWWDPEATGPDERRQDGVGMYRYVDGGKRYLPGTWPTGDPKVFVDDGTAVALYEQIPAADAPPDYPPPKR